ncbi:MAG: hypothetical protein VBE63_25525, partial [Lamprobacter sp.]|uniref:PEP-CTERM sorting domain-containing protein n=1 Tax=Lamprobacter sp. TaxID=3100796 RepID=UPI002B260750
MGLERLRRGALGAGQRAAGRLDTRFDLQRSLGGRRGAHSGLVYDAAQELTWLQDANYAITSGYDTDGRMTWGASVTWADQLVFGGWDDWRLWSVTDTGSSGCNRSISGTDCGYNIDTATSELGHLWYETLGNLAYYDTNGNGPQSGWGLQNTGPFQNFDDGLYWSGTEYAPISYNAWVFSAYYGYQQAFVKSALELQAWAVRPGQVDVAALDAQPVPTPGTLWLAGAGLLGLSLRRRW